MVKEPEGTDTEFEALVEEGIKAARAGDDSFWRLGDLALRVTKRYSRQHPLKEFADRIHVSYQSLCNCRRVAKAFPESSGRSELSWSHHMIVAGRKDAGELLVRAQEEGWSVRQLARQLGKRSDSKGLAVKPPRLSAEGNANLAVDLLQQVVTEARCSPADAVQRLALLERRLFQYVVEIDQLRLDTWYRPTPEERSLRDEIERAGVGALVAAMEKISSAQKTEDDPEPCRDTGASIPASAQVGQT